MALVPSQDGELCVRKDRGIVRTQIHARFLELLLLLVLCLDIVAVPRYNGRGVCRLVERIRVRESGDEMFELGNAGGGSLRRWAYGSIL